MDAFKKHVAGFVDTKLLLRSQFLRLPSYTRHTLVSSSYIVTMLLMMLYCHIPSKTCMISQFWFTEQLEGIILSAKCNFFTWTFVNEENHLCMDKKIAVSDLNYAVLKLAFSRRRGHTTSFVKRVWKWTKSNKVIKDQYIRLLNILDILL